MSDEKLKSAERFTGRVRDYALYRPSYPRHIIDVLARGIALEPDSIVADIGCGTGLLASLFLANGNRVVGIEPNDEMRQAANLAFRDRAAFECMRGTAEATGLREGAVDVISAGQAAHWFDIDRAREEFLRILRPEGNFVLVWNIRRADTTPFLRALEALLVRHGEDYEGVTRRYVDAENLERLFGTDRIGEARLYNHQLLDWEGLRGRVLSASYMPAPGDEGHAAMVYELAGLYETHQRDGRVRLDYDTEVFYGPPAP
jgi:SAM-dependent methyltransferase